MGHTGGYVHPIVFGIYWYFILYKVASTKTDLRWFPNKFKLQFLPEIEKQRSVVDLQFLPLLIR